MTQLGPIKFPMQLKLKEYKKYIFELKIIQTKYFRSTFISWKMSMYTYMYNPSCSILPTLADQGNSPRSALIACLRLAPYFFEDEKYWYDFWLNHLHDMNWHYYSIKHWHEYTFTRFFANLIGHDSFPTIVVRRKKLPVGVLFITIIQIENKYVSRFWYQQTCMLPKKGKVFS